MAARLWGYRTKIDWRSNFQCTMRCSRIVASKSSDKEECMNRRRLLTTAFAGAAASMLRPELEAQAPAAGGWPIKPLPFDPKKLKGLSEKLIVSHHDNNYAGAVRRIGQIQQMLAGLPNNAPGFQIKGLRMEELIATNSAILHEESFGNLGANSMPLKIVPAHIAA